jgi:hypothetical protein
VCFQVPDRAAVDRAYEDLRDLGVQASAPRLYPEYAPDYYAIFFADPDGLRLEIIARRVRRDEIAANWDRFDDTFLNPLARLRERGD